MALQRSSFSHPSLVRVSQFGSLAMLSGVKGFQRSGMGSTPARTSTAASASAARAATSRRPTRMRIRLGRFGTHDNPGTRSTALVADRCSPISEA
jgi:hypothetical protein